MKKLIILFAVTLSIQLVYSQVIMTPDGPLKIAKDTTELSSIIDSLYKENKFSGVVAISRNGKIIYLHIKGYSNKEHVIPITAATMFNLGSMNKMFTGIAIAQLAERGKIELSDPVSKYLPEFPNKSWSEKATIENLLTHTSGLGDFFPFDHEIKNFKNLSEVLDTISRCVSANPPVDKMQYSNAGFYFLGRIIEKASGQDYFSFIKTNILEPAGMKNTSFETTGDDFLFASGYITDEQNGTIILNDAIIKKVGGPAGGAYSNIEDLLAFQKALKENILISDKTFQNITQMKVLGMMPGLGYGLGIGVGTMMNGTKWIGHNGGAPGIATDYTWFPESGYSTIVLINLDSSSNMPLIMNAKVLTSQLK